MKIYHKKNFAEGLFMLVLGLLNLSTGISQSSITIQDGIVCAALFLFGGTLLLRSLSPSASRQDKIEAMDEWDQLIDVQAKSTGQKPCTGICHYSHTNFNGSVFAQRQSCMERKSVSAVLRHRLYAGL